MSIENILQNANFLVVDDMGSMREVICSCLRNLGAKNIMQAGDGHYAWSLMNQKQIDFIISDWSMPRVSGIELLQKARLSENYKDTPFLLLTGSTEKEDVKKALAYGVSDYLGKPFAPKDLEYRVIKHVSKIKLAS